VIKYFRLVFASRVSRNVRVELVAVNSISLVHERKVSHKFSWIAGMEKVLSKSG